VIAKAQKTRWGGCFEKKGTSGKGKKNRKIVTSKKKKGIPEEGAVPDGTRHRKGRMSSSFVEKKGGD